MSLYFVVVFVGVGSKKFVACRWQARKEGDRNMRAGLIPSRALQERRIIHERTQSETDEDGMFVTRIHLCCFVADACVAVFLFGVFLFING